MNKPKSTVIEITRDMWADIGCVVDVKLWLIVENEYKVWRDDGKIYLEVFHND